MKKFLKKLVSCIVAAATALSMAVISPEIFAGLNVTASASTDETKWNKDSSFAKTTVFSTDTKTVYGNSPYSIKIENKDYSSSILKRTVSVKPDTTYILSAYVKYSGYNLEPGSKFESGAKIRISGSNVLGSSYSHSEGWEKLSIIYQTKENETSFVLKLINGMYGGGHCKGTAWFSDIRLEEVTETTNQWNVLVLIVKHIKADAVVDGKTVKINNTLTNDDIKYLKEALPPLKKNMSELSNGLVGIKDIDIYTIEETVTKLETWDKNKVSSNNPIVSKAIDKYSATKSYQAIIKIVPLAGANKQWVGKGGEKYNGINTCQFVYESGTRIFSADGVPKGYEKFPLSGIVHEMLHGVEKDSKAIDGDKTPGLHDLEKDYGYTDKEDGWFKCYSDYMTRNLPDGRGINPKAYYCSSVYTLVTDDMTPGEGVTVSGTLPTNIGRVATVSKIADKYYAGKAVKPAVTVKGLTKGTDYTVSYENNNAPGTAKAIIKGKGKYTGSIEVTFKIKLKRTTAKISSKTLKWGEVPGADGYEIYYSKDGGSYKLLTDTKDTQYALSGLKTGSYKFKVRAYSSTNTGKMYASWSAVVKANKK